MIFLKKNLLKKVLLLNISFILISCSFGAGKWDSIEEDLIAKQKRTQNNFFY